MLTLRYSSKTAVIGSNIYVLSGIDNWSSPFEMYSAKTNTWKKLEPAIKRLTDFSVCSFMKSIYVIGGCKYHNDFCLTNTIQYNEKKFQSYCYKYEANNWTKVADLQNERCFSACTVFEGKIVVTGGNSNNGSLRSVEAYDHHENKWTYLSDMVTKRYGHSAVSMGNKMFVICKGYPVYYEFFDNISRKLTMLYVKPPYSNFYSFGYEVLSLNNKLVFFCIVNFSKELKVNVYDVVENKWIVEYDLVKYTFMFSTYSSLVKYSKT